jgi:uncharacterized protein YdeI (BOF family)
MKRVILFLLAAIIYGNAFAFEYDGPGSASYTQRQEQQFQQAQQQANLNATAQGWTRTDNSRCGTNGCS